MARKLKYFDKLLLVIGGAALLTFFIYVFAVKRSPRYYYIPKGYSGWVTIRFEKPYAPALEYKDGAYNLRIPESGILETSSPLESGWARDEHFWMENGREVPIPKSVSVNGETMRHIHQTESKNQKYDRILLSLPERADTTLWDGARIDKIGDRIDMRSGRNVLEHFFVTPEPRPFFHRHDTLPEERKYW